MEATFPTLIVLILILCNFASYDVSGQVISIGTCPEPPAMRDFDIERYYGRWFKVAEYPLVVLAFSSCTELNYFTKTGDGNGTSSVIVSLIQAGREFVNVGSNRIVSKDGSADLVFKLIITQSPVHFPFYYPYKVLHTDYESYTIKYGCTQVGPFTFQNLWVLSRDKTFSPEMKKEVYGILKDLGISTQRLKNSDFSKCAFKKNIL